MHADLSWDQLQLMVSRSTTPDLIRIAAKLDEFGEIHIRKGARLFGPAAKQKTKPASSTEISRFCGVYINRWLNSEVGNCQNAFPHSHITL